MNIFSRIFKSLFRNPPIQVKTLNKSICQKCYNQENPFDKYKWQWTKYTDIYWDESKLLCCPQFKKPLPIPIYIENNDLSHCPYYLEHVLSNKYE